MVQIAGWELSLTKAEKKEEQEKDFETFSPKIEDDGATLVAATGGYYATYIDIEGTTKTEAELVSRYREMSLVADIDQAIEDIVNDAMDTDDNDIVSLNLDKLEYSDKIKKKISEEFDNVLDMLDFNSRAYDIFRRYYIDGRMYYHAIIDKEKPEEGIQELRYIDPRKIKKIREVKKETGKNNIPVQKTHKEYFAYSPRGYASDMQTGQLDNTNFQVVKIAKDAIIHITSGLMDKNNTAVLSYLHKAIRPLNQLRQLEDATVIYRLSRAPERRIFNIEVGGLPKAKAEQYVRDMMTRHKNKLVYDQSTGEIRDSRQYMTMLEDYWFPKREGRGTTIDTLPAGQSLGEMGDVEYFQQKLYRALNVPVSRLEPQTGFNLGRSMEISRDELKFAKFISRLRRRFSHLFLYALEKQLVLKKIISSSEWPKIRNDIVFDFAVDNHFAELKHTEILNNRIETLSRIEPYVGRFYSAKWVRKNILYQTDEEIEEMDKEIDEEKPEPGEEDEFGGFGQGQEPTPPPKNPSISQGGQGDDDVTPSGKKKMNPAEFVKLVSNNLPATIEINAVPWSVINDIANKNNVSIPSIVKEFPSPKSTETRKKYDLTKVTSGGDQGQS